MTPTATPSPTVTPSPTPTLPLETAFGVQVYEGDLDAINRGFLNTVGANWIRTRALWNSIEPADSTPRARNWAMTDAAITASASKGLRQIVVVYGNPAWAATTTCGPVDKVPIARYAEFLRDVVERYDGDGAQDAPGSPVVHYWEITNEPDFDRQARAQHPEFGDPPDGYGGCFGDDPAAYADMLRQAYKAVKAADSGAQVIFGPVAYDRLYDNEAITPKGPFRYNFVRDVLASLKTRFGAEGDWPFCDALSFHNYNDFRNNWDGPDGETPEIVGKALNFRTNQLRVEGQFDLSDKMLVASEMGLPSGPSDQYTERSETYQAAYVGQVMIRSMAAKLPIAIWFTASDFNTGECTNVYDWLAYGLMRTKSVADRLATCSPSPLPGYQASASFEPKPAHLAMATLSRTIGGAVYDRQLAAGETGSPEVEAHRVTLVGGRSAIVVFTDTGERLGKRNLDDLVHSFTVSSNVLPGWTGKVRVVDYLGGSRVLTGDQVTVEVTFKPTYVVVEP